MRTCQKWIIVLLGIILLFSVVHFSKQNFVYNSKRVYIGHNRLPQDERLGNFKDVIVKGNSKTPLYLLPNFLSSSECSELIKNMKNSLTPSNVTRADPNDPYFRTSKTGYFNGKINLEKVVDERICKTLGLDEKCSESSQVQFYDKGNEFKAHYDYFHVGHDDELLKNGQRTWTFMIYLNDVDEGGETEFINLKEVLHPKEGMAVVWGNLNKDGEVDENTLHTGRPVKQGKKYIITKWFLDTQDE